ncbi:helix-turn-helix domain-containing protein [Bacillus cereus]|nr:helix-turn-helix domain-containing protein [Bacillus cereus]
MQFGDVIKKIRLDKNMSQSELAKGIMGRSHLSELENNKHYPSYDKLILLLNRLYVSYDEFIFLLNDESLPSDRVLFNKLIIATKQVDICDLQKIYYESNIFYEKTGETRYYHMCLISKAFVQLKKNSGMIDTAIKQKLQPIKEFLFSKKSWYLYELELANICFFSFSMEEAFSLKRIISRKIQDYNFLIEVKNAQQQLFLNLSTLCIENERYEEGRKFAEKAVSLSNNYLMVYENIISSINLGLCQILSDKKQVTYEIKYFINLLRDIGYIDKYEYYLNLLERYDVTLYSK